MKRFQTMAAVSLAVGSLISACSQAPTPTEVRGGLEPQFGKAGSDWATKVVTNAAHPYVFVAGDSGSAKEGQQNRVFLRSFNRDGSLRWERLMPESAEVSSAQDTVTDVAGNVYLTYNADTNPDPFEDAYERHLVKFDESGRRIWNKVLNDDFVNALAVDSQGDIYVATNEFASNLYKYAPNGRIVWESGVQSDFSVTELAVSDKDELFMIGDDFSRCDSSTGQGHIYRVLRKCDSEYRLKFERSFVAGSSVYGMAVGSGSVYVAYGDEGSLGVPVSVKRYNTSGKLLLKRALTTGANDYTGIKGMGADDAGNRYLAGFIYSDSPKGTNSYDTYEDNVFISKYSSSLHTLWTYNPKLFGSNEVAFDVASRTTGEIYAAGHSSGKVNGSNKGGDDAFLVRLNGKGQKVWER